MSNAPPAPRVFSQFTAAATNFVLATETLSGASLQVTLADPAQIVRLFAFVIIAAGVGATTFTARIRRTNLAGALVGPAQAITTPASTTCFAATFGDDAPGDVASQVYVLTGTAAGVAAVNGAAYLVAVVG